MGTHRTGCQTHPTCDELRASGAEGERERSESELELSQVPTLNALPAHYPAAFSAPSLGAVSGEALSDFYVDQSLLSVSPPGLPRQLRQSFSILPDNDLGVRERAIARLSTAPGLC